MNPLRPDGTHRAGVVYRAYDEDDVLLYVGSSVDDGQTRIKAQLRKPGWDAVTAVTIEHLTTWFEARHAEAVAILAENPKWNRQRYAPPRHFWSGAEGVYFDPATGPVFYVDDDDAAYYEVAS